MADAQQINDFLVDAFGRINKIEEITGVDLREYHTFIHLAINIYMEEI